MQEMNFLQTIKDFLIDNYKTEISSIILFGSLTNEMDKKEHATDIDLLVVINDSCIFSKFKKIKGQIYTIQEQYWPTKTSFFGLFLKSLQTATGMFVNTFICYHSDLLERKFSKVFGVNPMVAKILVPESSVWISLQNRYRIIWGDDILLNWSTSLIFSQSDVIRSFILNICLSMCSLMLGTVKPELCLYSMESIKWSLFTWRNCFVRSMPDLSQILEVYLNYSSLLENFALKQFITYRKRNIRSKYLLILAPLFVLLVHRKIMKKQMIIPESHGE